MIKESVIGSISILIGAKLGKDYFSTIGKAAQSTNTLGDALADVKKKMAVGREAQKYQKLLIGLKTKQESTGSSSKKLGENIERVRKKYQSAKTAAKKYGFEIGKLDDQTAQLERTSQKLESRLGRLNKQQQYAARLGDMKYKALGVLGTAYAAGNIFASAARTEDAQIRLSTVINTDDVDTAMAHASQYAREYARNNMASEVDILNIQYALNSAGLDASTATLGSAIVDKVATVTAGQKEAVGEVVATVFNNLGDALDGTTEDKLTRIGDLLTKTQFKFQIRDFSQLGEGLKYASPTLSQFNISLEQGLTLLGSLNSAGLQSGQAGTAFSATMRQMSKASRTFGFDMVRTADGQLDVIATLKNLSASIGGFDGMSQHTIDALQKVFGEEGVRGVVLLGKQLSKLEAAQQDVSQGSKGIVDSNYQKFLNGLSGQWKVLNNNLQIVGNTIAGTLLPALNSMLTPISNGIKFVSHLAQEYPIIGYAIGGVAAGFVAVGVGLAVATAAMWLFNAAAWANPVTWIVAGVVALGAAVYWVYSNWGKITDWLADKFSWLLDGLGKIGDLWDSIFGSTNKTKIEARTTERIDDVTAASVARQNSNRTTHQQNTFNITTQPGQDNESIADTVVRALAEREAALDVNGA